MPGRIFRIKSKPLITTKYGNAQQKKRSPKPRERKSRKTFVDGNRLERTSRRRASYSLLIFTSRMSFAVCLVYEHTYHVYLSVSKESVRETKTAQKNNNGLAATAAAAAKKEHFHTGPQFLSQTVVFTHEFIRANIHVLHRILVFLPHSNGTRFICFGNAYTSLCVYILWTIFFCFVSRWSDKQEEQELLYVCGCEI